MIASPGRNKPCPCGSSKKFKHCCITRTAPEASLPAVSSAIAAADLTLIIETPKGVMVRAISSASPLNAGGRPGSAAEAATHDAAARWGLPDFVFEPTTEDQGPGRRELGDGLLILGDLGLVLQVKHRENPSSDVVRERAWLLKKSTEAIRQGNGSIRQLATGPRRLQNLRGRSIAIDPSQLRWLIVAILDHRDPPDEVVPELDEANHSTVVLLRRDWEFLFEQLKSAHAVGEYLERVADKPLALGDEPVRYYDLAQADLDAQPGPLPDSLRERGQLISTPLLPMAPAASSDRQAHNILRVTFEDLATTPLKNATEEDRLRALAELDRLPVGQRGAAGQFVLDAMDEVSAAGDGVRWRLRSIRGADERTHLGFGACSHPHTEEIQHAFGLWTQLRHHDLLKAVGHDQDITTVAILMTPRTDGVRPWDTTMAAFAGDPGFTDGDIEVLRAAWPTPASWDWEE